MNVNKKINCFSLVELSKRRRRIIQFLFDPFFSNIIICLHIIFFWSFVILIYLIISISEIERKSGPGSVIIIIINRNGFGTLHMKRGTKQNKKKNEINKQKHYYDKWLQAMITDSLINANSNKPINIHLNTHTRQTNTRNTIVRIFCIQLLIVMMMRNDFFPF